MAGGMYGIPGRAEGGSVEGGDRDIERWGWVEGADGRWSHAETEATGHWADDGTFVNDTTSQSYDPNTGEVTDLPPAQSGGDGASGQEQTRAPDPAGQVQPGQTPQERIQDWGWEDQGNGNWFHPETGSRGRFQSDGTFYNTSDGKVWDPGTGHVSDHVADPISPGEFLRRNPERFNEPTRDRVTPFSFDIPGTQPTNPLGQVGEGQTPQGRIAEWGWEDQGDGNWLHPETGARGHFRGDGTFLNETEGKVWSPTSGNISDLDAQGYMPFNQRFAFDPAAEGYQPFNEQFEFDTEDLYDDPGYQWRLEQGNKAVERSAAAGGMLGSGKTLKGLQRWSQGLASQEYRDAYGRSRSEFDQRGDQTRDAYGRASHEYDRSYSQGIDAYGRGLQEWGLEYGMDTDDYNRSWDQFLNRQNQWERDQGNRWERTLTTSLLGGA